MIERIFKFLREEDVHFSLVGGYAVALHGAVRGTVDIDLIIDHTEEQFERCEKALRRAGFLPRLPVTAREVFQFRKEYIEKRNLIAWSFYNPKNPVEVVDIIITHDLRSLKKTMKKFVHEKVPVLAIDELIAMKQASGRPQDMEDIRMLKEIKNENKSTKKT